MKTLHLLSIKDPRLRTILSQFFFMPYKHGQYIQLIIQIIFKSLARVVLWTKKTTVRFETETYSPKFNILTARFQTTQKIFPQWKKKKFYFVFNLWIIDFSFLGGGGIFHALSFFTYRHIRAVRNSVLPHCANDFLGFCPEDQIILKIAIIGNSKSFDVDKEGGKNCLIRVLKSLTKIIYFSSMGNVNLKPL